MHAFFIISYNRKYHNIEWLKLSFSRFAHHLSKSRVLIRPPSPSIVERARNLSTWDDGVICIKICKLMGVSLQTVFVSQPLSADEDWTRTKKKLLFSLHFQVTITHEILITVRVIFVLTATRIPTWQMCLIGLFLMLYLFRTKKLPKFIKLYNWYFFRCFFHWTFVYEFCIIYIPFNPHNQICLVRWILDCSTENCPIQNT